MPDEVGTGGQVSVTISVTNGATVVLPTDPDHCQSPTDGYEFRASVRTEWGEQRESGDNCILAGIGTSPTESFSFDVPAPQEPGTYSISFVLILPGSGAEVSVDRQITIRESGPQNPPGQPDCPQGQVWNGDRCVPVNGGGDTCQSDRDCPQGQTCRGGVCTPSGPSGPFLPCFADPNRACAGPEALAWSAVGGIALILLAQSQI